MPADIIADKSFYKAELIYQEIPGYPSCHGSSVAELPNGDLITAWYAGAAEKAKDVAILVSRLPKNANTWTKPEILHDAPDLSEGNPVLYMDAHGRLWFFYNIMYGKMWNDCRLYYRISEDGGKNWGSEVTLIKVKGWITRNHPLTLGDGTMILPIHNEVLWSPAFMLTKDGGKTWRRTGTNLRVAGGAIEPALIRLSDNTLIAYLRTTTGKILMTTSKDNGEHWSAPRDTDLPNPNAAVEIVRLRNGHLVLAFNDSQVARTPLTVALSLDEGKTWSHKRNLEDAYGEFSYPSIIQTEDGLIHVTYTYKRTHIKHAVFNEGWIMEEN
ncbi:MAG: sialidase family protein [bacterium]